MNKIRKELKQDRQNVVGYHLAHTLADVWVKNTLFWLKLMRNFWTIEKKRG